jgi:hypothetical protein
MVSNVYSIFGIKGPAALVIGPASFRRGSGVEISSTDVHRRSQMTFFICGYLWHLWKNPGDRFDRNDDHCRSGDTPPDHSSPARLMSK